jgi:enoyl-CoA hydratase/carnithine racemase
MQLETLIFETRDGAAYLALNRPESLNAINEQMVEDLSQAIDHVRSTPEIKAVAISGAGRAFCVGADLDVLTRGFDDLEFLESFLRRLNRTLLDLESLEVPVIAAVNGLARAGGLELILACDVAIVSDEARIGDNHTEFGVMPGGGATQRAPRRLGMQRAKELIFTAKWLDGRGAVDYGIALRSVPGAELPEAIEEMLVQFRNKSRPCLSAVKRAIHEGENLGIEDAIDLEIEHFMRYTRDHADAREGFRAFLEKRKPAWAATATES